MARITPPDRRDMILSAARRAFAERGFAASRMEDIAGLVGISKAALYLQFADKDAIFRAVIAEAVDEIVPQLAPTRFDSRSAADLLRGFVQSAMMRVTQPDIGFIPRIIIGESGNFPELAQFYRERLVDRVMALLEALLAYGVENGEFRPLAPDHAARSIAGGVVFGLLWKTVIEPAGGATLDLDEMAQAHVDLLLNGLRPDTNGGVA